jgi:hypothetical protein
VALFRLSEAQRAANARAFELTLGAEAMAGERARMLNGLADCPGSVRRPLALSGGDRVRDGVRVRVQGDAAALHDLAQVALADWRLRRAQATGDVTQCTAARAALSGADQPIAARGLIERLGQATVVRDPKGSSSQDVSGQPATLLSAYASSWSNRVIAGAPLPQYLAAVYGGELLSASQAPDLGGRTPEAFVDELAPAYPEWEPDALYVALGGR